MTTDKPGTAGNEHMPAFCLEPSHLYDDRPSAMDFRGDATLSNGYREGAAIVPRTYGYVK